MAYVSVTEWRPEQVTEWLKGVDNSIGPYLHWFSNNEVDGQQLLNLSPDELTHLGVLKLGHQEIILEAVQHLRNFHYELDRENLQLLALRLSCAAHSLYNEIRDQAESPSVPTQIMADVANVVNTVKPLVSWLDRPPFSGQIEYSDYKSQLLSLSLEMATCAQRDRFAERPVAEIRVCSSKLAKLADSVIQDISDPMLLQPATLDLATIKKRVGEDLGFFLVPSFHGIHQIGDMKLSSPAQQSGKIQQGDEIVQVNYQTVVGWSRKKVLALFEESPNDVLLTLKRRPRHVKIYGQIYMKPYRLPSRKRASPYSRWNDTIPSPRPELLTIPYFDLPRSIPAPEKVTSEYLDNSTFEPSVMSSSSDEEFGQPSDSQSPTSMRMYLPKPRGPIQRRYTLSGPPRPSAQSEQFWRELQLERSWRSNQNNSQMNNSNSEDINKNDKNVDEMFQLRDKSASFGNSIATAPSRPVTCMPFTKERIGNVKFDLPKLETSKNVSASGDKTISEEKDNSKCDKDAITPTHSKRDSVENNAADIMNGSVKLSISELNKLKRDAFFNNMEIAGASNEKSFSKFHEYGDENKEKDDNKSEDVPTTPGKVMQLIGSFERKEIEQKPNPKMKPEVCKKNWEASWKNVKEKSRLDKSSSTPAYDLSENEMCEPIADFIAAKKRENAKIEMQKNLSDDEVLEQKNWKPEFAKFESEKENHGQMVNTINDHLLPDGDFYGKIASKDDPSDYVTNTDFVKPGDRKKSGEIGLLDTVSLALIELNQREDHYERREQLKETGTFHNGCFPRKEIKNILTESKSNQEVNKPIPAQRKTKMTNERKENVQMSSPSPLPPKPRPRPLPPPAEPPEMLRPRIRNRTPPEPPPRPENTFSKPLPNKRNDVKVDRNECSEEILANDSKKGNLIISSPLSVVPGSPISIVPPIYDAGGKSNEMKHSPSHFSMGDRSPIVKTAGSPLLGRTTPILNVITEKEKPKAGGTLESFKAILTLGRKPASFNSPRSIRKKNALLAKKRNVSVKEVSPCDNSGILYHRSRRGAAVASWNKGYFVLQGTNFYGFKSKESHKADLFIHLPGFTCSVAEEVKSKDHSFKIYHTGTVFYFAADTEEDLQQWLDCVSMATVSQEDRPATDNVTFSETDSDNSDTEPEPETCFPTSPKMKKFLGSSPVPKPARSHQNLASDSKKTYDIQKRFGSLKKLNSQKHPQVTSTVSNDSTSGPTTEVASLDRKYLRFLGHKNTPIPVPTSQFRSYRRMQPPPVTPPQSSNKSNNRNNISPEEAARNAAQQVNLREPPRLSRRTLHSSNPSLIHPDMADYRITQERLAEFRRLRNQERPTDLSRFMTLEQFMLSRQEEEKNMRHNRNRLPEQGEFMTLKQLMLRQEEERQRCNRLRERLPPEAGGFMTPEQYMSRQEEDRQRFIRNNRSRVYPSTSSAVDAPSCSYAHNPEWPAERPQVAPRISNLKSNSLKLKNVAQYQPPPIPHSPSTPNQMEEPMFMAFEMALDQNTARKKSVPKYSSDSEGSKPYECSHIKDPIPDYPGIEYPPAFEPETYTLQYMLKNRRKRDANKNK